MYIALISTFSGDNYAAIYKDKPAKRQVRIDFGEGRGAGELQSWIDEYGIIEGKAFFHDNTSVEIIEADEY